MSADPRAELRALALWHTRRRVVDELLAPLLEYGPVAVDRVAERLHHVQALVNDEQRAFEAFVEILGERSEATAVVLDMFNRRSEATDIRDT
jgi:hypothetical protein